MTPIVIAEAGVNHNGDPSIAADLVSAAVACGADAVKFQTFDPDALVTATAAKAAYQEAAAGHGEGQREMLRRLRLGNDQFRVLRDQCQRTQIEFLSTPFDIASLGYLDTELDVARIKIGSGDLTNGPLLLAAARTGKPIILSTGMSRLEEVETALGILAFGYTEPTAPPAADEFSVALNSSDGRAAINSNVVLLHCTTAYPTPVGDVNLRAMDTLRETFNLPVGYSDHTQGISIAIAAAARGATVIEKHLTLDRTMTGPDHAASLEPDEFADLVRGVRSAVLALGDGEKTPAASELENVPAARRSLVAARAIRQGEKFTIENLTAKRPGTGLSPVRYWEYLGQAASRDFATDEMIEP